jgi:arylsulfatase A-like enzyme
MLQLRGNAGVRKREVGKTYSHDIFTESALEFLKRRHQKPFFLYLAYTIPHSPFNPPDNEPYANKRWTDIQKQYAAMITRMDRDIGKVLKALRDQGIADNTLVVFTSDNGTNAPGSKPAGDEFFRASGPFRGKKTTVFEGGIRVPTVFLWPGRIEAGRTNHTSGFQDIMPTLCELTGVRSPKNIDGISLLPTLTGKTGKQKQHDYFYWEFCSMGPEGVSNGIQAVLDVKNNLKAIRRGKNAKLQLYNIRNDPEESEDLADYHPGQVKELDDKIDSLRGSSELWPVTFFDYPEKKVRYEELIEKWASLKSSL